MIVYQGKRVVLPNGYLGPAAVVVQNGKIEKIYKKYPFTPGTTLFKVIDIGDNVMMPGVVDSHVHVNEPGRTLWEGYYTATRAAAAGGVTTIVDMPLNCIPSTVSMKALYEKMVAARGQCLVDVGFWGGVIPDNEEELQPMIHAGVCGFKCFLIHSGVDEFPHVTEDDLHKAMPKLQNTNSVLLFHAEVACQATASPEDVGDPSCYKTFLNSRPDDMEVEAIRLVCKLCLKYSVPCHIVHLSSAAALPIIEEAKRAGAPLTVETTHHYLCLNAEGVPQGATYYKCCPPIRSKENQKQLWQAVKRGSIDMVVSDHSPCTADLKILDKGDFIQAWGGISSLQFGLSLFWTFCREYEFSLHDVVNLLCVNTASLAGFSERKGQIKEGYDADFVIWNPDDKFELTPYKGMLLYGKVYKTVVRGQTVYGDGKFTEIPAGEFTLRHDVPRSDKRIKNRPMSMM